ncbi:LOW QUALITY PROTEIN: hypothetical protein MSG28_008290, partial [Choristoneura fumiferana]
SIRVGIAIHVPAFRSLHCSSHICKAIKLGSITLQDMGIRVVVYLDDFLLACQNPIKLREDTIKAVNFLTKLGWIINTEKSLNEPLQQIEYLGIVWNTLQNATSLSQKKILSIEKDLNKILRDQKWNWQLAKSLLGKLNFASFKSATSSQPFARTPEKENDPYYTNYSSRMCLVAREPEAKWISDKVSSDSVHHLRCVRPRLGSSDRRNDDQRSMDPSSKAMAYQQEELVTSLSIGNDLLEGEKGRSSIGQSNSRGIYQETGRDTLSSPNSACVTTTTFDTNLTSGSMPQYIPGICNDIADSLSRQKSFADWHLSERVTNLIFLKWGTPEIDLFATRQSRVVPAYVSRDVKDKEAQFTDAFSRVWQFNLAWIFPPPSLIPRVLAHLNQARGTYIIIVPRWEKLEHEENAHDNGDLQERRLEKWHYLILFRQSESSLRNFRDQELYLEKHAI